MRKLKKKAKKKKKKKKSKEQGEQICKDLQMEQGRKRKEYNKRGTQHTHKENNSITNTLLK